PDDLFLHLIDEPPQRFARHRSYLSVVSGVPFIGSVPALQLGQFSPCVLKFHVAEDPPRDPAVSARLAAHDIFLQLVDQPLERAQFQVADVLAFVRVALRLFVALLQQAQLAAGVGQFLTISRAHSITSIMPLGASNRSVAKYFSTSVLNRLGPAKSISTTGRP